MRFWPGCSPGCCCPSCCKVTLLARPRLVHRDPQVCLCQAAPGPRAPAWAGAWSYSCPGLSLWTSRHFSLPVPPASRGPSGWQRTHLVPQPLPADLLIVCCPIIQVVNEGIKPYRPHIIDCVKVDFLIFFFPQQKNS